MARDDPFAAISIRPTVRIGGQSLPLLSASLTKMKLVEALGGLSSLELSVTDIVSFADGTSGFGASAASPLKLGASIKIFVGDTRQPQEIFDGGITAIEAEAGTDTTPLFTILAEDRLFTARRSRRTRTYDSVSPANVISSVAADHGLTPEFGDGFEFPIASYFQNNESDLAFMRRVLSRVDGDMQVVGTTLQVRKLAQLARNKVALALGETLVRGRFTADLAEQASEVSLASFDPATGTPVTALAASGDYGPGAGTTGAEIMAALFTRVRATTGHMEPMSATEADVAARALYGQRARRFVRADGTAQGSGAIRVGTQLSISGMNPFFNNEYLVVEATHRFDLASGYLTDFIAESAYLGAGA